MADENLEAKLRTLLREEKVQLWSPPFTEEDTQPGLQHMQELAERYASLLSVDVSDAGPALERIRANAVHRGKGNQTYKETSIATLELVLPKEFRKEGQKKHYLETKLNVWAQDVMDMIADKYGMKDLRLILNGKTLSADLPLDLQRVRNNSKIMVLKVSEDDRKQQVTEEETKKKQTHDLERTSKGFQILSEVPDDPHRTPFVEIADQRGNPLKIPHEEQKALILAMGLNEKGRALMKTKKFDDALCHLLHADEHFGQCGSELLNQVDNYAVLQLDIVWCYRALEAWSCLEDGKRRLEKAEACFTRCYGKQQDRLLLIKGSKGKEEVLFLRLYLLQSLLSYIEGNDTLARQKLQLVESSYRRLTVDDQKMNQLMIMGFSERECRLALRACQGDMDQAALLITNRRQEDKEKRDKERAKERAVEEGIANLRAMGFSRRDASRALHEANGEINTAYNILFDSAQTRMRTPNTGGEPVTEESLTALSHLGFHREACEAALKFTRGNQRFASMLLLAFLRLTKGDHQAATQLLADHQGFLPDFPSSEENDSPSPPEDDAYELVNEAMDAIPRHEEEYLDVSLEEEKELINTINTYLNTKCNKVV